MKNDSLLPEALLGVFFTLALILIAIIALAQDPDSRRIDTGTNIKPRNAFWDRYCATRTEHFRSQSAFCRNR